MISMSLERPDWTARRANDPKEAIQDAIHTPQDRWLSALVNAHARVSGTHTHRVTQDEG